VREMELNRVSKDEMVTSFELIVIWEIRERVKELRESDDKTWGGFEQALKKGVFYRRF